MAWWNSMEVAIEQACRYWAAAWNKWLTQPVPQTSTVCVPHSMETVPHTSGETTANPEKAQLWFPEFCWARQRENLISLLITIGNTEKTMPGNLSYFPPKVFGVFQGYTTRCAQDYITRYMRIMGLYSGAQFTRKHQNSLFRGAVKSICEPCFLLSTFVLPQCN